MPLCMKYIFLHVEDILRMDVCFFCSRASQPLTSDAIMREIVVVKFCLSTDSDKVADIL